MTRSDDVTTSGLCLHLCRCSSPNRIFCNERSLREIPAGISPSTESLQLRGNHIDDITNLRHLHHLRHLDLYDNVITSLPPPIDLPSSIRVLSLQSNRLVTIRDDVINFLFHLEQLNLRHNQISDLGIPQKTLNSSVRLQTLFLSNNVMTSLPARLPTTLTILQIDHNRVNRVSYLSTGSLTNLQLLDLSHNLLTTNGIETEAMTSLRALQTLNLASNHLDQIPRGLPRTLRALSIAHNRVEYIWAPSGSSGPGHLAYLDRLVSLDLSHNQIKSVQSKSFIGLRLRALNLNGNAFRCDCHLRHLLKWLMTSSVTLSKRNDVKCDRRRVWDVPLEDLRCDDVTSDQIKITKGDDVIVRVDDVTFPPFVTFKVLYGPLRDDVITSTRAPIIRSLREFFSVQLPVGNRSFRVTGLLPGLPYLICIFPRFVERSRVTMTSCVRYTYPSTSPDPYIWFLILLAVLIFSGIFLIINKRRLLASSRTKPHRATGRPVNIAIETDPDRNTLDARSEFIIKMRRSSSFPDFRISRNWNRRDEDGIYV